MSAWIRGQAAALDAAVEEAATVLESARTPLIAGLVADVDGLRAAFALGARVGASFDPLDSKRLYADLAAWAAAGAMATTASETRARADLVLAVGAAAARSSIVAMVRSEKPTVGRGAGRRIVREFLAGPQILPVRLGWLRALASGRLAGDGDLAGLAAEMSQASYTVAVYDPLELGELGVEMLQGLIAGLNERTRAFSLCVGDVAESRTALQVALWTTGGGPRVALGRGRPEHDPWRCDGERLVAEGEADTLLWLAARPSARPAWTQGRAQVAVVADAEAGAGEIVIAVAAPGETADGVLYDDRRGTLALRRAVRGDDGRPPAAHVLSAIERAVRRRRSAQCRS